MLHRTDDPLAIASRNHTDASSVLGTPTRLVLIDVYSLKILLANGFILNSGQQGLMEEGLDRKLSHSVYPCHLMLLSDLLRMTRVSAREFRRGAQTIVSISHEFFSVNGSSLSLVSTASSIYSTTEEKQAHELRKVRRELHENQEKSTRSTTSSLLM